MERGLPDLVPTIRRLLALEQHSAYIVSSIMMPLYTIIERKAMDYSSLGGTYDAAGNYWFWPDSHPTVPGNAFHTNMGDENIWVVREDGAMHHDDGKPRLDLIPHEAVFFVGEYKFGLKDQLVKWWHREEGYHIENVYFSFIGELEEFFTSELQYKTDHGIYDLPNATLETAKVLTWGVDKYEPDNWQKGMPYSKVYNSAMRHLIDHERGVLFDHESGLLHLSHCAVNVMFLHSYVKRKMDNYDDRPRR